MRSGRWQHQRVRHVEWWVLSTFILVLVAVLDTGQALVRLDRQINDVASGLWRRAPHDDIVIVAIDDKSITAIGRWPWRRALHATAVEQIAAQSPRAIGIDVLFTEADREHPADDALLASTLRRAGSVVLPVMLQSQGGEARSVQPLGGLARSAAALGHVHLAIDADGVTRGVFLREGPLGHPWPHFSAALVSTAGDQALLASRGPPRRTPPERARDDQTGDVLDWLRDDPELIPFAEGPGRFHTVSFIDVLRGEVPADTFTGRYVLVGATAAGLGDRHATPGMRGSLLTPGVEMLAQVLDGLLSRTRLVAASRAQDLAANLSPVALALLGLLWFEPLSALLLLATLAAGLLGWAAWSPLGLGLQFTPAAGLCGLALIYPLWSWRRLSGAAGYLGVELARLQREPSPLPRPPAPQARPAGDFLDRRIDAVRSAAKQLRDLHRFVSDSLDQLPDPALAMDTVGHVLLANQAAARHFGAPVPAALRGRDAHALLGDILGADQQPLVPPGLLPTRHASLHEEGEDSRGRILLLKCVPLADSTGTHTGWLATLVDLTGIRQTQRQRDEALRFISHDIRAPHSAILTLLELQRTSPDAAARQALHERIERHARTALDLAESFVQLARAESQAMRLDAVDLVPLLDEAADEAWASASERQVRLRIAEGPEAALCRADRGLLARAISNVLGNAIKFSPQGAQIDCRIEAHGDQWALAIADQGPGLDAAQQAQLFQPFQRLHTQSHPGVAGAGLGLLFVRTVLQRHHGTLEIESPPGQGCTMRLVLPRQAD